jgi:hypothetical protein
MYTPFGPAAEHRPEHGRPVQAVGDLDARPMVIELAATATRRSLTPANQRLSFDARRMSSFLGWAGFSSCAAVSPRTGSDFLLDVNFLLRHGATR